ncbi:DUF7670 domain-containing protein [Aestuariivita boseongensis]|uniref:DUF7670 domain-containing protein n=1 Tax=Aestuariivita boseongensis TaxID=1470562 RepID=UPI0006808F90|nr:hypothetical protein [Aestuariivita boseongensis]
MSASATVRILRLVVRTLLVALALFWFIFAWLSGAAEYGQGIGAVIRNLPNSVPWLFLFIIVYIAFRWELAGGILIMLAGLGSVVFFDAWAAPVVLLGVSLPLVAAGATLVACHIIDRSKA